MARWLHIKVGIALVTSIFLISPLVTHASVDLLSEAMIYEFDEAWLEIRGEAKDSVYEIATLYVRHTQKNTGLERLFFIPVNVDFGTPSSVPFHVRGTWTLPMENLKGKMLSDILGAAQKNGMVISEGFISEIEKDEIYVIYSDRELVEIVDFKTLMGIPF